MRWRIDDTNIIAVTTRISVLGSGTVDSLTMNEPLSEPTTGPTKPLLSSEIRLLEGSPNRTTLLSKFPDCASHVSGPQIAPFERTLKLAVAAVVPAQGADDQKLCCRATLLILSNPPLPEEDTRSNPSPSQVIMKLVNWFVVLS